MNKRIEDADYYRYELKKLRAGAYYEQGEYDKAAPALLDLLATAQAMKRDADEIGEICEKLGMMYDSRGEFEEGRKYIKLGKETLEAAQASRLSPTYLMLLAVEGVLLVREGGEAVQTAVDLLEPVVKEIEATNDTSVPIPIIEVYNSLAIAQSYQGDRDLSIPTFDKAVKVSRDSGSIGRLAYSLLNQADDYVIMGEWDKAEQSILEVKKLTQQFGDRDNEVFAAGVHGDILNGRKQWEEAIAVLEPAIELGIDNEIVWNVGYMCADLAKALLALGRLEEAHAAAAQGLRYADEARAQGYIYEVLGRVETEQGKWDDAELHFRQAIQIQHNFEEETYEASAKRYYAVMFLKRAQGLLESSAAMFEELEIPHELKETQDILNRITGNEAERDD